MTYTIQDVIGIKKDPNRNEKNGNNTVSPTYIAILLGIHGRKRKKIKIRSANVPKDTGFSQSSFVPIKLPPSSVHNPLVRSKYLLACSPIRTHAFWSPVGSLPDSQVLQIESEVCPDKSLDAAIDSTKRNNVVPSRINSAFIARINGDWTPNYRLSCVKDDVDGANKKRYMGLWILDPFLFWIGPKNHSSL